MEVGRWHLRSSNVYTCTMPQMQSQNSDTSFRAAGPRSRLPIEICQKKITHENYKRRLCSFSLRCTVTCLLT